MQNQEIYRERIAALRNTLRRKKLDAFVSTFLPTMRYLCGYSGSNGMLVVTDQSTHFLTDSRYEEIIQTAVIADTKIVGKGSLTLAAVRNRIFASLKKIGVENEYLTVAELETMKKFVEGKKLIGTSGIVEQLRSVKDQFEIQLLQSAFAISDAVFTKMLDLIKPGISELEISAEISYWHKKLGAENDSFDVIVASGVRGSLPHGTASNKKIQNGEFVTLDFGCVFGGYHSDMTRTICVGTPTNEMKKVYRVVLEAQKKASDAVRNGEASKMIDRIARDHIAAKGYGSYFGHSLGHGIGLEIHELPRIAPKSAEKLKSGNVITIEPGIYIPQKFGIRIEDSIVVRQGGYDMLTNAPKNLIVL